MFIDLRERKGGGRERGGREREKKRNIDVREKHQLAASRTHPNQGTKLPPRYML